MPQINEKLKKTKIILTLNITSLLKEVLNPIKTNNRPPKTGNGDKLI